MMKSFEFCHPTQVHFGCGARHSVNEILRRENWQKLGLVIDYNLWELPIIVELVGNIGTQAKSLLIGQNTISEPDYDSLEDLRKIFGGDAGRGLQVIIGVGGGSTLDMAKAMAVLVHNAKPAIEYRGFNKMTEPVLPVIAIPTTGGSGSEVTPNASFIDTKAKKKMGINGEAVRPRYALLDPELTVSCPWAPTLSAAVDSLVHAVEAYAARKTNPMARLFAREGFRLVFEALPRLRGDLNNLAWRERVMYGAFLSGIALMHSGTGPAAAMSYPLGVHYGVAHGLGGAIFLPHVVKLNLESGYLDYAGLLNGMNAGSAIDGSRGQAYKFLDELQRLWGLMQIPQNLKPLGFPATPEAVAGFVQDTLELKGALEQNPAPFGAPEIEAVLAWLT